jgi:hypothetical protein
VSAIDGEGGATAPAEEVPAGEASPETLRRLEAALPGRDERPPVDEQARRSTDRHALLLIALVACCIVLGVVSVLALLL